MTTDQFRRWLNQQSSFLKRLGEHPEPDLLDCEEAAGIVQQARQLALDNHLPEAYEAGKVRGGPLSIGLARSALSRMIRALPASDTYTPSEVATRLGTKASTVRGWIASGRLKAANIGERRNRYVIQELDLQAFLESQRPQPPQRRRKTRSGFKRY